MVSVWMIGPVCSPFIDYVDSEMLVEPDPRIFLGDQLTTHLEEVKTIPVKNLALATKERLQPIWRKTLTHIRGLDASNALIESWTTLGEDLGFENVIGCSWYRCPLFRESAPSMRMSFP